MTYLLKKEIKELKQIADKFKRQDLFKFSKNHIIIKPKTDKVTGILFYIILTIIIPSVIFVYELTQNIPKPFNLISMIGVAGFHGFILWSLLKGQQILTVDLSNKQFVLENVHKLFTRQKEPLHLNFNEVHSITSKRMSLRYYNKWTRISFCDEHGNNLAYFDLSANLPNSINVEIIRSFLSVVLLKYKKCNEKKVKSA